MKTKFQLGKNSSSFFLSILLLLCPALSRAQDEEPDFVIEDNTKAIANYSLDECIDYAFRYSEDLKRSQLDVRIAQEEVGENVARGLPSISAQADFNHNFKIQRGFISAASFATPDLPPEQQAALEDSVVVVQFNTNFAGGASVTLEQLIFDFSYLLGLKAARSYEELERRRIDLTKTEIAEQVSKSYYAVLISEERVELLQQNYKRLDTLLRETTALYENGFAEELDVMRTEVAFNNIKIEKQKAEGTLVLAQQLLKFQMGMPLQDSLILVGSLDDIKLDMSAARDVRLNYANRTELDLLERQKELRDINLRYTRALYYPQLKGFLTYGSTTGSNNFGDFWRFQDRWFGYGLYGFTINIPIMDGLKNRHTLQKIRIEKEQIELDIAKFKRSAEIEVVRSQNMLEEQLLTLESEKRNMELAQEVSRRSQIKYQNGVGSNIEIVEAETAFKEAETNYYTTLYQAIVSKIDLDKALGLLVKED